MKAEFLSFSQTADRNIVDQMQRGKITSIAVALAISNHMPLPSSPVESPATYMTTQVAPAANDLLSTFNENLVFDYRACLEQIRSFWMIRYHAAHPIARPIYGDTFGFFNVIMGVGLFTTQDFHDYVNKYQREIVFLTMAANDIIAGFAKPVE